MSLENFGNFLTLDEKHSFIKKYFKEFYTKDFKLFASKDKHYRTRAELSFYHEVGTMVGYFLIFLKMCFLKTWRI